MLAHSINTFHNNKQIRDIMVVVNDIAYAKEVLATDNRCHLCLGSTSRNQSVYQGLRAIAQIDDTNPIILVHDAARPCLHDEDLSRCLEQLTQYPDQPLILANKATDSIKQAEGQWIETNLARDTIWHAQTPQCARLAALLQATADNLTDTDVDEATLLQRAGHRVRLLQAQHPNIKVTWQSDVAIASTLLGQS